MPTLTRIGRSGRVGTGDLPNCALRSPRYRGNDPCPKQTRLENSRETKLGTLFATYGEFRPTEGRHGKAGDMTNTGTGRSTAISSTNEAADLEGQTPDQFQKRVKENFPDLVLTADQQGQWRGMEALEVLRRQGFDIPMIVGESTRRQGSTQAELAQKMKELARSNEELEQFAMWLRTIYKSRYAWYPPTLNC